jgi:hypothetical protein
MTWGPALLLSLGILFLVLCAIIIWPPKRKPLGKPDYTVGRDCYREFKS